MIHFIAALSSQFRLISLP